MQERILYMVPVGISATEQCPYPFPTPSAEFLASLGVLFVEDARTARRFLRKAGYQGDLNHQLWVEIREKVSYEEVIQALQAITPEQPGGVLSEAGIPGVADPGAEIAAMAHQLRLRIVPLPGPSSIFMALSASGLNGQQFTFHGYLPVQENERNRKLKMLEQTSLQTGYTQIFIETPYRNKQMFESILKVCREDMRLCIAANITGEGEVIRTLPVSVWKKTRIELHKIPAVFLINQ
jgi:16S rRNA (cytidine1402-2'-O)-methyltransferase